MVLRNTLLEARYDSTVEKKIEGLQWWLQEIATQLRDATPEVRALQGQVGQLPTTLSLPELLQAKSQLLNAELDISLKSSKVESLELDLEIARQLVGTKQKERDKYKEAADVFETQMAGIECLAVEVEEARLRVGKEIINLEGEVHRLRLSASSVATENVAITPVTLSTDTT